MDSVIQFEARVPLFATLNKQSFLNYKVKICAPKRAQKSVVEIDSPRISVNHCSANFTAKVHVVWRNTTTLTAKYT